MKAKAKKLAPFALLGLAIVIALVGCGSPSGGSQLTPDQIGARVLEASGGIETY